MGKKLGSMFGGWTRNAIKEQSSDDCWIEKRVKMSRLLPLIESFAGELAEEMKAYASAADVDLLDAWVLSTESEFQSGQAEKCTTILSNKGKLLAHNEDWSADATEAICVLNRRIGELSILEFYYFDVPLGGTAFSVNSFGLCSAVNSLPNTKVGKGLPRNVIARLISQSRTTDAAVAILKDVPRYSGYNHVLTDISGASVNVECSSDKLCITKPQFPYAHTNHYQHMSDMPLASKSEASQERLEDAMSTAKEAMTVHDATNLLHHGCPVMNDRTIGSFVVDLESWSAIVWLKREEQLGWVNYRLPELLS